METIPGHLQEQEQDQEHTNGQSQESAAQDEPAQRAEPKWFDPFGEIEAGAGQEPEPGSDGEAEPLNRDAWTQLLYDTFSDAEYRKIARSFGVKVAGFSHDLSKAPLPLLRKETVKRLSRYIDLYTWLKLWFEQTAVKYRNDETEFEEFCQQLQVGNELTTAEAVGLTGLLYPEAFNRHEAKLRENIKSGKHPLAGLSTKKLTFKWELQVRTGVWSDPVSRDTFLLAYEKQQPELCAALNRADGLKEWLLDKQEIEPGELAYAALAQQDGWGKWQDDEKTVLLSAALHDANKLWVKSMLQAEKEKTTLEKEAKQKERRLARLEKANQELDTNESALKARADGLRAELAEAERQVAKLEEEKQLLEARLDELKERLAAQAEAHAQEQSRQAKASAREQEQSALARAQHEAAAGPDGDDRLPASPHAYADAQQWPETAGAGMLPEEDVRLLTRFEAAAYAPYVPADRIIAMRELEEIAELPDCRVLFIHSDGFTTKELFAMDDSLRLLRVVYRYVSGSSIGATRQIIYYLEGDRIDETDA